jgi:hypothetical protein
LQIDLRQIHRRQQKSHTVGIQPQRERKGIRWQRLVIVCTVFSGGSVVVGTSRFQLLIERTNRDVLRSHEHDVLEQVREACSPDLLVTRPYVVPRVDGHDRRGVIFMQNDLESVRQFVLLELDARYRLCPEGSCHESY